MNTRLRNALRVVFDSGFRTVCLAGFGAYRRLDDKEFLEMVFKRMFGRPIDWDAPTTYNEKLQWLKLHDRNPAYITMVDKHLVKGYVASKIGEEYVIPTLGVWDKFEDIDFDELPSRFVLKCTHDSGGLVICEDKERLDVRKAKRKINACLKRNYYWLGREWPYKMVKPRIIAEKFMEDDRSKELRDYKFFCFDGEPKALFVASDRQNKREETKFDFFDMEFNHLPFTNGHPNASVCPEKPDKFDEMVRLARVLSEGIPHVRVDFYEVTGRIYFGELTFYHWSGFEPFVPSEWDKVFGDWIQIG